MTNAKLKKKNINVNKITICLMVNKWKNKRKVYLLGIKHSTNSVNAHRDVCDTQKPLSILHYNPIY